MIAPTSPCDAGFVLNVRKPESWTSHDAVSRIRRVLNYRRVGHTGTLDPFAGGVLLCCIGRATKLSSYLMDLTKEYEGAMLLGRRTTTGDIAGETVEECAPAIPDRAVLLAAASTLTGEILQVPPMVSALKHQGVRLYKLARQGITVERAPRRVFVERFEILGADDREIGFRVRCARGTYVRTLVEDFGARIGLPACVARLCRTQVGQFRLPSSLALTDDLDAEHLMAHAISMPDALGHLAAWKVPAFWVRKLRDGHVPPWVVLELDRPPQDGEVGRLMGDGGDLVAIGRAAQAPGRADRAWHEALDLRVLRVI
jgi:tRNA pseudouridine55 synthase